MAAVKKAKKDLKNAKAEFKANKSVTSKSNVEKKKKALERMEEQLTKLQVNLTDKVRSHLHVMRELLSKELSVVMCKARKSLDQWILYPRPDHPGWTG